jgi:hypothetical protein
MKKRLAKKRIDGRVNTSLTLPGELKDRLDVICATFGKDYRRLHSRLIDLGVQISVSLIEKHGPGWFIDNENKIVGEILENL